jgi:hypothetical protein
MEPGHFDGSNVSVVDYSGRELEWKSVARVEI